MLADQTDQCHQADLGVDVHARPAKEQRKQRATDRQRHGDQNHQRVAEAFELGGQHQENDGQCQGKGDPQRTAFLHVLPRCAGIVDGKSRRGFFPCDLAHGIDGFTHADQRHPGKNGRIELLELVQLPRPRPVRHRDQCRQGQQLALTVLDVVMVQPVRVITEGAFDLGNDFVTATLDGEPVDFRLTQQGGQCAAEVLHRYAHLGRLGTIDIHDDLRLVEGQVDIDERELAGLHRALFHPVHHLQQQLVIAGGVDDELEGQALASAWEGGQVESENLQSGNARQFRLNLGQNLHLGPATLVPWFEQEATDPRLHTVETVDLERRVVLGKRLEDRDELVGIGAQVIKVGRLRGVGQHENDALVFIRSQFRFGELDQHRNQAQHDHGEHQHYGAGVERAMQHFLIAALQPFENQIQTMGQAAGVFVVAQQEGAHHR